MSIWHKRVELFSNVAIIVVAVLLGAVLVNRYLLPTSKAPAPPNSERPKIIPGTKLTLDSVEWAKRRQTLLLALSTTCHFCTESAPFYQRLAQERAKHADVALLAVLPQSLEESHKYLGDHGVKVDEVRRAGPETLGAAGTPTLILVDHTGSVIDAWVGKLPPEQEAEVLKRFLSEGTGD